MSSMPVPASTVILLRDGPDGPEALLLERHARSAFLPDMYVFPGGRVEEGDRALFDAAGGLAGGSPQEALPMVDPAWAAGYFAAAIRETYEESGILLARADATGPALDAARVGRHRLDVQAGRTDFGALLAEHALALDLEALTVHAHWITPESVGRRFDTVFFTAVAPEGQRALHDGVESTDHVWIRPEDALAQALAGTRQMIFPTSCNLETLCGFERAADVWEASRRRPVVTVLPWVEEHDGRRRLAIPADAGYVTIHQEMPGELP